MATAASPMLEAIALIARATTLHRRLAAVMDHSRALLAEGRERRLTSTYPTLRPIRGSSDAGHIVAAITNVGLCAACIADRAGIPAAEVEAMLGPIMTVVRLDTGERPCDACGHRRMTFSVVVRDGQP
jgi:hypothetical protein